MSKIRKFDTGATRDTDNGKLDYEGFLSFPVTERFAQYMHKHRKQSNGELRDSDNWQKGIPIREYQKSLKRHVEQAWGTWRGYKVLDDKGEVIELEEALTAIIFNAQGYLHEILKKKHDKN